MAMGTAFPPGAGHPRPGGGPGKGWKRPRAPLRRGHRNSGGAHPAWWRAAGPRRMRLAQDGPGFAGEGMLQGGQKQEERAAAVAQPPWPSLTNPMWRMA